MIQRNKQTQECSPQQLLAIEARLAGKNETEAAEAAGVNRSTLYRWDKDDEVFQSTFKRAQREQAKAVEAKIKATKVRAAQVLMEAVDKGDLRAAMAVLRRELGAGTVSQTVTKQFNVKMEP